MLAVWQPTRQQGHATLAHIAPWHSSALHRCVLACPHILRRYRDGEVDLVQTHAILRYLARRHGLYGTPAGASEAEAARAAALVDQLVEGIADLKSRIVPLVYRHNMQAGYREHIAACGVLSIHILQSQSIGSVLSRGTMLLLPSSDSKS